MMDSLQQLRDTIKELLDGVWHSRSVSDVLPEIMQEVEQAMAAYGRQEQIQGKMEGLSNFALLDRKSFRVNSSIMSIDAKEVMKMIADCMYELQVDRGVGLKNDPPADKYAWLDELIAWCIAKGIDADPATYTSKQMEKVFTDNIPIAKQQVRQAVEQMVLGAHPQDPSGNQAAPLNQSAITQLILTEFPYGQPVNLTMQLRLRKLLSQK